MNDRVVMTMQLVGLVSLGLFLVLYNGLGVQAPSMGRFEIVERGGMVFLNRISRGTAQPIGDRCGDIPELSYAYNTLLDPFDDGSWAMDLDSPAGQAFWRGLWSVRPLHIWGLWSDIGCKEPMGWGTVWQAGLWGRHYIWISVGHVGKTNEVGLYGRQIFTDWFVQDDEGNFRELRLVGCKPVEGSDEYRFCAFVSSVVGGVIPISFDEDYIQPSVKLGEPLYAYGCVPAVREVRRFQHYELHFLCSFNQGIVNSANTLPQIYGGGDFASSLAASPGTSGSPIMAWRDGRIVVVGTVNGGIRGYTTTVYFVDADAVQKVEHWLETGENIFGEDKP